MTVENAGPDARQQAKPRARGHIEQPGERDPQSQQPAGLASTSGQPLLAH